MIKLVNCRSNNLIAKKCMYLRSLHSAYIALALILNIKFPHTKCKCTARPPAEVAWWLLVCRLEVFHNCNGRLLTAFQMTLHLFLTRPMIVEFQTSLNTPYQTNWTLASRLPAARVAQVRIWIWTSSQHQSDMAILIYNGDYFCNFVSKPRLSLTSMAQSYRFWMLMTFWPNNLGCDQHSLGNPKLLRHAKLLWYSK